MQPVLALAPLMAPMPEMVVEMPPSPEGAFLASLEAETAPDLSVALPVMTIAVPAAPAIVVPVLAPAETVGTEVEATTSRPLGDAAPVLAKVAPQVAADESGRNKGMDPPAAAVPQMDLRTGMSDRAGMATDARSATGDTALTMAGSPGRADGPAISDAVRQAVPERGKAGSLRVPDLVPIVSDGPKGKEIGPTEAAPAQAPGRTQGLPIDAALPAPRSGNPQTERPQEVNTGAWAKAPPTDAPPAGTEPKALAPKDGQDALPGDATLPETPAAPGVDPEPTDDRQPRESAARPGIWESMFKSLSLPPAEARPGDTLRPLPSVQDDALLSDAADRGPVLNPETEPTSFRETPRAEKTAAHDWPKAEVVKLVAALPALAPAPLELASPGTIHLDGEEVALGAPAASGSASSGATIHSPAGALAPQSTPVPQVAAQITAALTRSADGATELALAPEELGQVRLRLEPDSGNPERMVVMITFERPETLDLFRRHAGELAEALRAAGYSGADIGFGQDHAGSPGNDAQGGGSAQRSQDAPETSASASPSPPPRAAAGASLDLRL